jgi:uncharacterized repeat protein (TIGR03803 family)
MNTRQVLLLTTAFLWFSAGQVHAGWTLTTVASFNGTNGYNPSAGVTFDSSGNLYGTTYEGGGTGTVYEIAKGSSAITTIVTFKGSTGSGPSDSVTFDAAGNMYGTVGNGGANGYGSVFEIAKGSNTVTTIAPFSSSTGSSTAGVTFDAAGNMYGTTLQNASGYSSVWEIAKGSNAIATFATFNNTNGYYPSSGVTLDAAGNMYGTTSLGGASGNGVVWEIAKGTNVITTLASFNGTNGYNPQSSVVLDAAGDIFGTTELGGANDAGTIWEIVKSSNAITVLASFNGNNGDYADPTLTFDASGNLWGTSNSGGANNDGYVFERVNPNAVPEPSSFVLMTFGGACLCFGVWRKRRMKG